MLLFEEDLKQRQNVQARFLAAQDCFGLGDDVRGRALLQQVLDLDCNHAGALDWNSFEGL